MALNWWWIKLLFICKDCYISPKLLTPIFTFINKCKNLTNELFPWHPLFLRLIHSFVTFRLLLMLFFLIELYFKIQGCCVNNSFEDFRATGSRSRQSMMNCLQSRETSFQQLPLNSIFLFRVFLWILGISLL